MKKQSLQAFIVFRSTDFKICSEVYSGVQNALTNLPKVILFKGQFGLRETENPNQPSVVNSA